MLSAIPSQLPSRVYFPSSQFTFGGGLIESEKKVDLNKQAVTVPNSEQPGFSPVFRNALLPDDLLLTDDPKIQTLYDSFNRGVSRNPEGPCVGHRKWDPSTKTYSNTYYWQTYKEIQSRRDQFGAGLLKIREEVGLFNSKVGKLKVKSPPFSSSFSY